MKKNKQKNSQENMLEHSLVKIEFYQKYLEIYLEIVSSRDYIETINIIDVFCGMGIYKDGNKGSPIISFEAIKKQKSKGNTQKFNLLINDIDSSRVEQVKSYINEKNKNYCNVYCFCDDANDMFIKVDKFISTLDEKSFNLLFIDPYGYKDIKKDILKKIMRHKSTEIILFLPVADMYRFTKDAVKKEDFAPYQALLQFINSFFPSDHPVVKGEETMTIMDYIEYLRKAFCFDENKFYTASYYLERSKNYYFALFFITTSILGYDKIIEVKWKLNPIDGRGFKYNKQTHLFTEQFNKKDHEEALSYLENNLVDFLKIARTNVDLYEYTLKLGYMPKHTVSFLKKLQNENKLNVVSATSNKSKIRKGSFYVNYENYNPQKPKVFISIKKK